MSDQRDAEIARLGIERDKALAGWKRCADRLTAASDRANQAEAERDAALARNVLAESLAGSMRCIRDNAPGTGAKIVAGAAVSHWETADATAALTRRDAQMRAEGMRKAAEQLKHHLSSEDDVALANVWIENIEAAAEKEDTHG